MAKINSKNRRRRTHHPAVTVFVIVLLVAILVFVSKMLADNTSDNNESDKQNSPEVEKVEKVEKTVTESQVNQDEEDQKTPIQNDGDDPNTKDFLTGVLTMAEVSGDVLRIRLNIDQYLASGNCELTLTSNQGVTFTDSAAIVPVASTSTCEGFDIPTSNLATGNWTINISLEAGDKIGTINGEVNI